MTGQPATVGRYHVVRLIAHGGMGSLYLARDPAIERLVAIKLLKEGFDDAATRERFAREARAAGRLHHPNIVTVFDVGEHEHRPFIAMEYVAGETLAQLIGRRAIGRLSEKLAILEVLCAALQYAHNAGIVHRDIKPANVMVDSSGVLKVLDFGIARAGGLAVTGVGDVVGTLNYMSPEQLAGNEVDHRTDIYSVGTLAYELVTSQMAFPGSVPTGVLHKILNTAPPPVGSLVPQIDPDIATIIEHAMAKDPDARYQELDDMREDLAEVRTRLIDAGLDIEEVSTASADAETRAYGAVASTYQPKSSQRSGSMLRSSRQGRAARSAIRSRPGARRRQAVLLGVVLAALAVAVGARWIITRPPDAATQAPVATPAENVSPQPGTRTEAPPVDARPAISDSPPIEERLSALRTTARQQIAAGERQAAVETLARGLALAATDQEINALLDDLIGAARREAIEARTAAARRGGTSARAFRNAQGRERDADTMMRRGDRIAAIRAFWAATSSYNQVPTATDERVTTTTPPAAPLPPTAPPPAAAPVEPESSQSKPVQSPATPPLKPSPEVTEKPVEKTPAPIPPPKAEPQVPQRAPKPDPVVAQREAILTTLRRYSQAYQSLDSAAVGAVMPALTAEQLRNLDRDFANYRSYVVAIRDERISVDGETATVTCQVERSFETKNGVTGRNTLATVFHLRRVGTAWTIERLESR